MIIVMVFVIVIVIVSIVNVIVTASIVNVIVIVSTAIVVVVVAIVIVNGPTVSSSIKNCNRPGSANNIENCSRSILITTPVRSHRNWNKGSCRKLEIHLSLPWCDVTSNSKYDVTAWLSAFSIRSRLILSKFYENILQTVTYYRRSKFVVQSSEEPTKCCIARVVQKVVTAIHWMRVFCRLGQGFKVNCK